MRKFCEQLRKLIETDDMDGVFELLKSSNFEFNRTIRDIITINLNRYTHFKSKEIIDLRIDQREINKLLFDLLKLIALIEDDHEDKVWKNTKAKNSINAYKVYLVEFPHGRFSKLASQQIEQIEQIEKEEKEKLEWSIANKIDTIRAFERYCETYPQGQFVYIAKNKIRKHKIHVIETQLASRNLTKESINISIEAIEKLILETNSNRDKLHSLKDLALNKLIEIQDKEFWKKTFARGTSEAYQDYIETFPNGLFFKDAKREINTFIIHNKKEKNKLPFETVLVSKDYFFDFKEFIKNLREDNIIDAKKLIISKYPIRVREYLRYCKDNYKTSPKPPEWGFLDDNPIVNVNWFEAKEFCEYYGGRLPYDYEWNFVANSGSHEINTSYSGGKRIDDLGWYSANSRGRTRSVGMKKSNDFGIYDMSGNVWEWCENFEKKENHKEFLYESANQIKRLLVGGSWSDSKFSSKINFKKYVDPFLSKGDNIGIRFVKII